MNNRNKAVKLVEGEDKMANPQPGDWVILVWDAEPVMKDGKPMGKLLTYFVAKDESGAESATSGVIADALEKVLGGTFSTEDFELEKMSYEDLQKSGYIDGKNPNKIDMGQGHVW